MEGEVIKTDVCCSEITRITLKEKTMTTMGERIIPILYVEIEQGKDTITLEKHHIIEIQNIFDGKQINDFIEIAKIG
jgi:hypothetical protein